MSNPDQRNDQFNSIYNAIHRLLAHYGVDNALGEGDYDICADNYNNRDFYILVNNISVIRSDWVRKIQFILPKDGNWVVHVRLGIPAAADRAEVDSPGVDITRTKCVELWDRSGLETLFGKQFRYYETE